MTTRSPQRYFRCFISAPYGMDLGVLPILLGERRVGWNWSEDTPLGARYASNIEKCEFFIAIFDGSRSDQRVLYEAGLAEGLRKPIFAIATNKRVGKVARSLFNPVDAKLTEREALAFNLDAFLSTPHETVFERDRPPTVLKPSAPYEPEPTVQQFHSQLEARVFEAVKSAGGSVVAEPEAEHSSARPDLLIWLSSEDAELFDPAVIEVKPRLDATDARRAEQQLLEFMQAAGIQCGFLLTEVAPPEKRRPLSPYVFWLSIDHFVALTRDHRLGQHVRSLRNRAAHGAA